MTEQKETRNLMGGLLDEMNRCRELLKEYESIPQGAFGAAVIRADIVNAEIAIRENDVVKMLIAYQSLKECK